MFACAMRRCYKLAVHSTVCRVPKGGKYGGTGWRTCILRSTLIDCAAQALLELVDEDFEAQAAVLGVEQRGVEADEQLRAHLVHYLRACGT
eukprot:5406080-Pleurochrysis_carterae.AAC.4